MNFQTRLKRWWGYFLTRIRLDSPWAWIKAYEFHLRLRSSDPHSKALFQEFFLLMGKVLFTNSRLGPEEVRTVHDTLRATLALSDALANRAIRTINSAKHDPRPPREIAAQLSKLVGDNKAVKLRIADVLLAAGYANGQLSKQEQYVVMIAFQELGLSDDDADPLNASYVWRSRWAYEDVSEQKKRTSTNQSGETRGFNATETLLDDCYRVLGCRSSDSNRFIKMRYRKLVMQLHPDRVVQEGATKEFIENAQERFRAIQEAYEEIEKLRPSL